MYVQNVLKNQLNKKNKTIALNVEDQIGLFQLMIININNILIILILKTITMKMIGEYILIYNIINYYSRFLFYI